MDHEEEFLRNKAYLDEYSKQIREGILKSHEHFDKTLTLISTGGLALSMVFVEKLGGSDPIYPYMLISSWGFFGLTLLLSLTSSIVSIENHKKVDKSLDIVTDKLDSANWTNSKDRDKFYSTYSDHVKVVEGTYRGADFLTWAPYISLTLGAIFLIIFASINILTPNENGKRNIKASSQSERTISTRYKGDSTTQAATDSTISTTKP